MRTLYFCPVVSSSFFFIFCFFSFLAYSQRSQSGCLPYFDTWRDLSANLECRFEMCCTRLAGNTGRKDDAKNRHLGTIAQLCQAISLQLRHISTVGKKLVKQQYVLHIAAQYGELRLTSGWDRFREFGAPQQISTAFASWRYCTPLW